MTVQKDKKYYYSLLKVKMVERGFGYAKGLEVDEETIKKSMNLESLIKELEDKYPEGKDDWIIIPKYLMKEIPYRYEKFDFVIVKTELKENDIIEGYEK